MRIHLLIVLCAVGLAACKQEDPNAIGSFALEGTRTESCGDSGLLASPPALTDTVVLRKGSQDSMQWQDSNGLVLMEVGPEEGRFSGRRLIVVDMRLGAAPPEPQDPSDFYPSPEPAELPPCSVQRLDIVEGMLEGDEQSGYSGFGAKIDYQFTPTDGSNCDDLHNPEHLANGVPCNIAYDATATRNEE